jgi:hypothetical protein
VVSGQQHTVCEGMSVVCVRVLRRLASKCVLLTDLPCRIYTCAAFVVAGSMRCAALYLRACAGKLPVGWLTRMRVCVCFAWCLLC